MNYTYEDLEREMPQVLVVGAPTDEICDSLNALFEISRGGNPRDSNLYMALIRYFVLGAGSRNTHPFFDPVFALLLTVVHWRNHVDSRVLPAWRRVIEAINSYGSFRDFFLHSLANNFTNVGIDNGNEGDNHADGNTNNNSNDDGNDGENQGDNGSNIDNGNNIINNDETDTGGNREQIPPGVAFAFFVRRRPGT